jgi:phospholipid/cholesterol/gamma-HCH transport system ATP-binding protein
MIEIEGLDLAFGSRQVLKGINLSVDSGEIVALMGSSGGGKTTLLRCISGLLPIKNGKVTLDGVDVRNDPELARHRMGMVFQQAALFDYMDVGDNVLFGVRRRSKGTDAEHRAKAAAALERVGLKGEERKMPAELSGGMRKRVGIARAVALDPKVILYDEPTTGLDPITTYTIDRLIVDLRSSMNVTSLVVSHDVSSIVRVADRIVFLHQGELIFNGTPKEFIDSPEASIHELVWKARAEDLTQD